MLASVETLAALSETNVDNIVEGGECVLICFPASVQHLLALRDVIRYAGRRIRNNGLLKPADGEPVTSGEEIRKVLREYLLTVFTQQSAQEMLNSEESFGEVEEKLMDVNKTKERV